MYLLQLNERSELSLVEHNTDAVPPYAILSHTWDPDASKELTFQDVKAGRGQDKAGFAKVRFCGEQAKKNGLHYFWVDSCCINRENSVELSEAILSMFRWYRRASRCYVYMEDVSTRKRGKPGQTEVTWEASFRKSRWFTRGWTLQELLAPKAVEFFSRDQDALGDKVTLESLINTITGIPLPALRGAPLAGFSNAERLRWIAGRETKREEDKAYCLMGIFKVFIPPMYGERDYAFYRLLEAIDSRGSRHESTFIAVRPPNLQDSGHGSSPDTQTVSRETRRQRLMTSLAFKQMDTRRSTIKDAHRTTCEWLLQHAAYLAWDDPHKSTREHDILWIKGKPGAGKSTLVKFAHFHSKKKAKKHQDEIVLSFFFNARGGDLEKTTIGMYRSFLFHLLKSAPDLHILLDEIDTAISESDMLSMWTLDMLQSLFTAAVAALGKRRLKCFIDALDECDEQQVRDMVTMFEDLCDSALEGGTQLCICFASRHYPEIRIKTGLSIVLEDEDGHNEDLKRFIHRQLEAGDGEGDERIRRRIQEKSNGVFMWAVLVIELLNREYRVGRMWAVEDKLEEIPEKLSQLFKKILQRDRDNMSDLLLCLQWILFSKRPLRAEEFYFAIAAKLDRARPRPWSREEVTNEHMARFIVGSSKGLAEMTRWKEVQFIHESVRDFLLRDGGLCELWPHLSISLVSSSHDQLKQCCQNYLAVDLTEHVLLDGCLPKAWLRDRYTLLNQITARFPFIDYASQHVFYHANAAAKDIPQDDFLENFALEIWLRITNALQRYDDSRHTPSATLLYILAETNSAQLIKSTLTHHHYHYLQWNRIPGERYGYPLLAAFAKGNRNALAALIIQDVCTCSIQDFAKDPGFGRDCELRKTEGPVLWAARNKSWALAEYLLAVHQENALSASGSMLDQGHVQDVLLLTAEFGPTTIIERLTKLGAAVNRSLEDWRESALFLAARGNRISMVRVLLDRNINVINCSGRKRGKALYTASERGFEEVVQLLLDGLEDVNAAIEPYGNALYAASQRGYEKVVQMLLNAGANVNDQGEYFGNALQAASSGGKEKVVHMLLNAGASVNAQGGYFGNALQAASLEGYEQVVQMLLNAGANANAQGGYFGNALQAASSRGYEKVVQMLLNAGANGHAQGGAFGNALQAASSKGHEKVVQMLLKAGASANAQGGIYGNALQAASAGGYAKIVQMLIDAEADVNARGGLFNSALEVALSKDYDNVVQILLDAGAIASPSPST